MLIKHEKEKLYNAIVYFIKNTRFCQKTKLMKLLYFLDFFHFRETGKSITGLKYYAWDFGPYPVEIGKKISNNDPEITEYTRIIKNEEDQYSFIPKRKFDDKYFTKRELRILEEVAFIFKNVKAKDIVEISHLKNMPWDRTLKQKGEKAEIDYFLSLEESSPPLEKLKEDIADREAIEKAFI